ncbi:MAG TPA: ABC transporter permease [Thermoleophilaceae bacterium]|nr:ABC transporter permease [Thermoleophilaceae bacterium]
MLDAVGAFLRRDYRVVRSYRFPFVLDTFFGILQLAVSYFIAQTFEGFESAQLGGAPDYFAFAAIGIVMALVVEAAAEGLAEKVRFEQTTGTLEALMAQPIGVGQLCAGLAAFPFAFSLVRTLFYLSVAAVWMDLDLGRTDWLGLAVVFLLSTTALAGLGILAAAAVIVFKRGETLSGILLFGMTLVSGSVFPVSVLPGWLEQLGSVLPLRFAFDGVRDALFTGEGWSGDALALGAFTVLGLPLAVFLFGRALDAARRAGSLGEY